MSCLLSNFKSRLEIPQKLTQLSPRSHPRHLVGKRTAQKTPSKTPPATAKWTAVSHTGGHRLVCESRTLIAELDKRTQIFELRCYRRLLDISYKDHITSEEVRRRIQTAIGEYDKLITMAKKRNLMWFGHVSRSSDLASTIRQVTVNGKRRGKQKKRWEDTIKELTGINFASSTMAAEDRTRWKGVVAKSHVVPQRLGKVMGWIRLGGSLRHCDMLSELAVKFSFISPPIITWCAALYHVRISDNWSTTSVYSTVLSSIPLHGMNTDKTRSGLFPLTSTQWIRLPLSASAVVRWSICLFFKTAVPPYPLGIWTGSPESTALPLPMHNSHSNDVIGDIEPLVRRTPA